MNHKITYVLVLLTSLVAAACSHTLGALTPQPTVAVEESDGSMAMDVSDVTDQQKPDPRLTVNEWQTTLTNGFESMAGDQYTTNEAEADLVLKLTEAELEMANIGNIGHYQRIRYRGGWYADGKKLASVAGIAEPRNPTETDGKRHIEDVVEVMFQQVAGALEKVRGIKTRDAQVPAEGSVAEEELPEDAM